MGFTKKVCFAHIPFIGIMCSKFHLDDLKNVEEASDTNFHQRIAQLTVYCYPFPSFISWKSNDDITCLHE